MGRIRRTADIGGLLLSLAVGFGSTAPARADTYHRFWRGTKLASLTAAEFAAGLNQVFIQATVQTGAGKGMIAYEPVLPGGLAALPDEVALVSYADKPAYDALYSTDAGKAYQNLHWRYFDRASSHSATPGPYVGKVELEQAYDFHPAYAGWQNHQTTVLVFLRKPVETDPAYLSRAAQHLDENLARDPQDGILDRAVLVAPGYWLEYVSGASLPGDSAAADLVLPVRSESPGAARIVPGSGVNLQF